VLAKNNENPGDAFGSKVEGFNANENFGQTGIGLLLRERY
jgi:hypothetical protein